MHKLLKMLTSRLIPCLYTYEKCCQNELTFAKFC